VTDRTWVEYNSIDGAVTYAVMESVERELEEITDVKLREGYRATYRQTIDLYGPLVFMMTRGLRIDKERLEATHKDVSAKIDDAQRRLDEEVGHPLNANSPKQCITYFYGELGLPPYLSIGRGTPTCDDKALARLARREIKAASLVQEVRGLSKLRSTYLEVTTDPDGRIRSSMNPRGTKNGRLSSSQNIFGTGMNLQNLDPRFKSFITADPGMMFLEIDKAKAEWVVTAYASGDPTMIAAIESGVDIHAYTGGLITGVPAELILKDDKLIGHRTDADEILELRLKHIPEIFECDALFVPRTMSVRQAGKKTNHGCNYIEGPPMFALTNEIPEKDAKPLVMAYRSTYSHLPIWWDAVKMELGKSRTLYNCFGRPRRFLDEWNHDLVKQGVAFIPQSTVVDILNKAMILAYNSELDFMEALEMLCQVHDSLLSQYPVGNFKKMAQAILELAHLLNPTMEYGGREFQINSDLKVGLNWGEYGDENLQGMRAVPLVDNLTEMADHLEQAYEEMSQ
jgi:DNA polymerase I-like protein with 3'-5' exonuclease and polymerase domains